MQGFQQGLTLFALFITITSAEIKIISFGPLDGTGTDNSIYATHIELWAEVTGCREKECECTVRTANNNIEDEPIPLTFHGTANKTSVQISELHPNSVYSFTLTCKSSATPDVPAVSKNAYATTDYARPLAPKSITASLNSPNLTVNWSPPSISTAPISFYRIQINNVTVDNNISNDKTSFQVSGEYKYDTDYKIVVSACYKNNQHSSVCSLRNGNEISFRESKPSTTSTITTATASTTAAAPIPTTTATTAPPPKSTGVHSYSISISMIIFSLLFFI